MQAPKTTTTLVDSDGQTLCAQLHPFARPRERSFISIVRGRGSTVTDANGNDYIDALASLWYCNIGHGRPEITAAIHRQAADIAGYHTFDRFTNAPADALAEELSALAPMPQSRVFFTSSGSEAVDSAIKIARMAHSIAGDARRQIVISRNDSYHGVAYGGVSVGGIDANREHFGPLLDGMVRVERDDLAAVEAAMRANDGSVAAVIAEPVIGAGGVHPASAAYLQGLRRLCDEHGAFLILDEVICGFGRLGAWWGAQVRDVVPDLVTFAKAVTSGYLPLGGVLVGEPIRARLEADETTVLRHGHTYSGHPLSCAVATECLRITREEGLLARAAQVGQWLFSQLQALHDGDRVMEVRGEGAIWAVELGEGFQATLIRDAMVERGVIARPLGGSTIAFCPPLVIEPEQVDRCVETLEDALQAVART